MGKPGRSGDGSQQGGNNGGQTQNPSNTSGRTVTGSGGAYDFADNLESLETVITQLQTAQEKLDPVFVLNTTFFSSIIGYIIFSPGININSLLIDRLLLLFNSPSIV